MTATIKAARAKKPSSKRPRAIRRSSFPLTTPTKSIVIVPGSKVARTWSWLSKSLSARPSNPQTDFYYDQKSWTNLGIATALAPKSPFTDNIAFLYLISQLSDPKSIVSLANNGVTFNVILPSTNLDSDISVVINNKDRFRHALSEHLAFWVQLATISKIPGIIGFGCASPNFQPEDKGPDGLSLSLGTSAKIEVYSVKSSIKNPSQLIASRKFRTKAKAERGKQLEDFWLCVNKGWGLGRLDRLLDNICGPLNISPTQKIRYSLLNECAYNAIVVANEVFGQEKIFHGFHHITPTPNRRIATYIGSTRWKSVAEKTRQAVTAYLVGNGVSIK